MGSWVGPAASLLGIGWFFAFAVIAGIGAGWWLDSVTGLEPIFTLAGIVLGLAVAFVGGLRMLQGVLRRLSEPSEKTE